MGAKPFKTRSTNAKPMASLPTANNVDGNNSDSAYPNPTVAETLERRPKLSDKLLPDKNFPIELRDYDYVVPIAVFGPDSVMDGFYHATNVTRNNPGGIDRFFVNCLGWKVRFKESGGRGDTAATLVCLDVSSPDFAKELKTLEVNIEESLRWLKPSDPLLENIILAGLNADCISSIFYDPWEHARRILVAIRPDADCAFAVLPTDVIYLILSFLLRMLSMELADSDRVKVHPPPWERRRLLSEFCGKIGRPMYLASTYERPGYFDDSALKRDFVGVSELLHSIVERTLDTYGVVPNPAVKHARVVNPYCVRDFPVVVPTDDV